MSVNAGVETNNTQGQESTGGNTQGNNGTGGVSDTTQQQQQQQTSPYAQYLEKLPETARPLADPVFKEWDANVTQRFQQLHSQYAWAKPWEEIAQEYEPDAVSQAIQIQQALTSDPEGFYKALAEAYGFNGQQNGEQGQPQEPGETGPVDPRIDQLQQTVNQLTEFIMGQHQQTQEQQEEQQFIQLLTELQEKHGQYDVDYVLAKIAAGDDPETAILAYKALAGQNSANASGQQAPVVLGGGGGMPSQTVDPKTFSPKQTQDYVASVLAAQQKP